MHINYSLMNPNSEPVSCNDVIQLLCLPNRWARVGHVLELFRDCVLDGIATSTELSGRFRIFSKYKLFLFSHFSSIDGCALPALAH